jgi:hypothetical protein
MNSLATPTQRTGEPEAPARASVPERFRRLKRNEVAWSGDFVADERLGFELWERRTYSEPARLRDQFTGRKRPKDSDRPQPENQNKTQNIAMKTPKITARSRYYKQSVQLH